MKFCKRHPFSNYSDDLAQALASNFTVGPPLLPVWKAVLESAGATRPADSR
jgi:hypothetical protein